VVLATADAGNIAERAATVQDRIGSLDGVAAVFPSGVSADGTTAMLSVTAESGPLDDRTTDLVRDIRNLDVDDVDVAVTGSTAIAVDSDEKLHTALIVYLAIIVGLSVLLLVVLFRSLFVPIIATLGFLLSLGAGMGATVAIFQWGWLDGIVAAPQGNPLLSLLPIITTGILFGLAMDYQVFLVSRIHEAHRAGQSPHGAIRSGFLQSGSVIAAAAAIMVAVFGGFALSPSSMMASIALALAAGVVADAFVVRMIIVPALLAIVGERAWWIPKWLDRVLPELDVEGNSTPDADEKQTPRETQAVATD
jgi:RND superfamily putative drug exporter